MQADFWHERWADGRIGFHQQRVHPALEAHHDRLADGGPHRVLVPLCGKSWDLDWLARQGHDVVGVELSQAAVEQFHEEQGREPEIEQQGPYRAYRSEGLTLLVGDLFHLPEVVATGHFDRVWDRASMVALPPDMRKRYVDVVQSVARGGAMLLATFSYDQRKMSGPPFSVPPAEVTSHYPTSEELHREPVAGFADRGAEDATEHVWWVSL